MSSLSKEAIARVQEAEQRAAAIRAEAEAAARTMVEENRQRCKEEAERQVEATARMLEQKLESVRQKTEQLIQRSGEEAGDDAAALEAEANEKMREAVRIIVWEMFHSCQ